MFKGLLQQLKPGSYLAPCAVGGETREEYDSGLLTFVPGMLAELDKVRGASARLDALGRVCDLTEVNGGRRRVKLVCTLKWDVIAALSSCLTVMQSKEEKVGEAAEARKVALLTLKNLLIPCNNKTVMSLGASSGTLLGALTLVVD
mmetsp:Transcript_28997/g.85779  ORF Transcript_28997/g.85779 Transcript_28997/m.85779 type:complete len:146 (+) Transcript_28997:401-838(+)